MENFSGLSLLSASSPTLLLLICGCFLLAGFVKGVVGLGLPTVAMGLLGTVMPPLEAASLLVVPSLVTNIWQLAAGPALQPLCRRLWPMLAGVCGGTLLGAALLQGNAAGAHAATALGIALILYAVSGLVSARLPVPPRQETWLGPAAGIVTGVVTVATGVFVLPAVPYLQGLGLKKDELVQALGLAFTVSTLALAASLVQGGALHADTVSASCYALVPALGGMFVGQWLRAKISADLFRRCFFSGLLALGGYIAVQSILQ